MIDVRDELACARFQRVAWEWLQSGEMTRTGYLLSPMEELCGYKYGFIYLLTIDAGSVKIGFSEHPQRRIRELHAQYGRKIRLRACFVGEPAAERFAHRRFCNLRIRNELFVPHPIIDEYFASSRRQMREKIAALHVCSNECPQLNARLDLRMLGPWLAR
ncbi:MAG: GIY-YIG nuclease family protein [Candidatus Eremiobacteraeota bacterium]|nr:GIY-YIG nuclease family protein [Candidatus Eremiobacteraeota bacterium]